MLNYFCVIASHILGIGAPCPVVRWWVRWNSTMRLVFLVPAENMYSKLEKEGLAIVLGGMQMG